MKIAVCVKYVPVVSRITFDYAQKRIVREGVPSEINPFDLLGLVCAVAMKRGPQDQVVAISMGPPQAREGLVQCLALGADRAILLTDRALAGSDTLATARALALVMGREKPDLIICGRNSTDAETGQVGPELAELLEIPHISQVRKLDYQADHHRIQAERTTDEGYQVVDCALPALICAVEGIAPETYPNRQQMAEAAQKPVEEVNCAQISADPSLFGLAGSPTWVQDIRLVQPNRLGVVIEEADAEAAARQVADLLRQPLSSLSDPSSRPPPSPQLLRYPEQRDKSIWVVAETVGEGPSASSGQRLRHVTLEMLGKARQLTGITRSEVAAVLIGPPQDALVNELVAGGADRVLVLDHPSQGVVASRAVSHALGLAMKAAQPYAVLFAATADGRDLASRIAARWGLGLTGDAIDLEINDQGQLVQLKPALGGNVVAPILSKTLPNLVTLRPGLLSPVAPDPSARATVETVDIPPFSGNDMRVLEVHRQEALEATELERAPVVLGVGIGIGGPENLHQVQALARSLGATLAATRDVVHAGWIPEQVQVGLSGRTIAPRVYLAVGIRGAFNHTVGIQKAGVIIAINQNRRAPIFRAADYGIVGDWKIYLPPLVEALKPSLVETV